MTSSRSEDYNSDEVVDEDDDEEEEIDDLGSDDSCLVSTDDDSSKSDCNTSQGRLTVSRLNNIKAIASINGNKKVDKEE